MKKIKLIFFILISININGCSQNKTKIINMETLGKTKTDVDMKNIYQLIKKFNYNPRYIVDYSSIDCTYKIFINGIDAIETIGPGNIGGAVEPVTDFFLRSGKQKIKILISPPKDENWVPQKFLTKYSSLEFTIKHGEFGKDKMEEYKTVFSFHTPKIITDNIPYLEFEEEFYAEVPYELEGWENSEILTKRPNIEADVLEVYNKFRDILINKDTLGYADLMYKKELEIAQAMFWNTKKDSEERWDDLKGIVNNPGKYKLIENYELVFLADGKIAELRRNDLKYKGECVIRRSHNGIITFNTLYLHMPKGSNKLEVIR